MVNKLPIIILALLLLVCLTPFVGPPIALGLGVVLAQFFPNLGQLKPISKYTHLLLKVSIIGYGFGVNLDTAINQGVQGFVLTSITIGITLVLGAILLLIFRIDRVIAQLISVGTAICGGSAIAAISPILKAKQEQMSVALAIVFLLNAIALFLFPLLGSVLGLSEIEFGTWVAIAIHDTSSVVGAATTFGDKALEVATTIKLTRALFIIPLVLITAFFVKSDAGKIKLPYFIGLFILAILINSILELSSEITEGIVLLAKKGFTLTLLLIGLGLSWKRLRIIGMKPLILAIILWVSISLLSLLFIEQLSRGII